MREKSFVYLIKLSENGVYKLGVSKDVEKRIEQIQTENTKQIKIIKTFLSQYPYKIENVLYRRYKSKLIQNECFHLEQSDIDNFDENCIMAEISFQYIDEINNFNIK